MQPHIDMPRKTQQYILALDIGGTKLAVGLFDRRFTMLGRARVATRAENGPDAVFARITTLLDGLMKRCGIDPRALLGIGTGCGGPLDPETGVIYSPPNLPGWDAYPLKDNLEAHFGAPAFVENDANAAALGEHRFGAGQGYRHLFYITASTGIGGGLILGEKLYRGRDHCAGEFGHIVLRRNGPVCNCGGRGCLEALASGTAIARRARKMVRRQPDSLLAKMSADRNSPLSAKDVVAAARKGDALAASIIDDAATYLGLGIVSAIHLLNPEIVIIGGGLSRSGRLLFDTVRRVVKERAQEHLAGGVPIVPAALGTAVGIYGALATALDRLSPPA
jgi:glucokinase